MQGEGCVEGQGSARCHRHRVRGTHSRRPDGACRSFLAAACGDRADRRDDRAIAHRVPGVHIDGEALGATLDEATACGLVDITVGVAVALSIPDATELRIIPFVRGVR